MDDAPLILTLRFDAASFAHFEAERRRHFPPELNRVPAHLTLFHHLPGDRLAEICRYVAALAAVQHSFSMTVASLRFLGRGTAYVVESPELTALRSIIAERWSASLTRQDAQGFRPHVTVQNKSAPDPAKALFEKMSASFQPFEAIATGLLLWRYRHGPWEAAGEFGFEGRN